MENKISRYFDSPWKSVAGMVSLVADNLGETGETNAYHECLM